MMASDQLLTAELVMANDGVVLQLTALGDVVVRRCSLITRRILSLSDLNDAISLCAITRANV